ncbi:hypothetical protein [Enterobacter ludwigii]|uniref:hypothetical protein n=1 Tax=Enterobacter ludwigii TaxID=299767 RepID=UPI002A82A77F|nr:hypothetical protein [Enterobacter ludwigii]
MNIAFWNTGINHSNDRDTHEIQALQVINNIFHENKSDILFICEVDDDFITQLSKCSEFLVEATILPANQIFSRNLSFGICAIHKKELNLTLNNYIKYNDLDDGREHTGSNIKVGVEFGVAVKEEESDLSIIVSHWPSKITPEYEFKHKDAAEELRNECIELLKKGKQVILIGDYNKTPEQIIMDTNLKSYSNKYYVLRDSKRLFNLSFSFTGQHRLLNNKTYNESNENGFGTFISKSSRTSINGCAVLDHAHVSSSFLSDGPWLLKEDCTKIIYNDLLKDFIYGNITLIDHLPIYLEVYKND